MQCKSLQIHSHEASSYTSHTTTRAALANTTPRSALFHTPIFYRLAYHVSVASNHHIKPTRLCTRGFGTHHFCRCAQAPRHIGFNLSSSKFRIPWAQLTKYCMEDSTIFECIDVLCAAVNLVECSLSPWREPIRGFPTLHAQPSRLEVMRLLVQLRR